MGQHSPFLLFRDSNGGWCAAPPGFRNFLRDPIGRGESRVDAVHDLLAHPDFVQRARMGEWPEGPGYSAFIEVTLDHSGSDTDEFASLVRDSRIVDRRQMLKLVR